MFIDTHTHLSLTFQPEELKAYLSEEAENLSHLIDISVNSRDYLKMREMNLPSKVKYGVGIHPCDTGAFSESVYEEFLGALKAFPPDLIGEIGMDFHHESGTPEEQEALFRRQLGLAVELKKPVCIHSREAFEDSYRILSSYDFTAPVIMHCFGYGAAELKYFTALGFYISFAGNLTFKKANDLHEAAEIVPLERVLFETDAPYLSPVPYRGKPNRPHRVEHTYRYFAEKRGIGLEDLKQQVKSNFEAVFGK